MRKFSKLIALLMVLILSLSLMGCGKAEKTETTEPAVADAPATEEATVQEDAVAETTEPAQLADPRDKYEAFDFGGRTIKVLDWYESLPQSTMEEPDPATALPETVAKYENLKRIEEKYNCKIQIEALAWDQVLPQLTTSVLSGDSSYDIAHLPMNFGVPAITNELVLPISEYAAENSDVTSDNIAVKSAGKIIDNDYCVVPVGLANNGIFMVYNKTLLTSLGLEDPQAIYKADPKAWNWDKFLEYAKAATVDTDGDGNVDQFGYSGWVFNTVENFAIANGGGYVRDFSGTTGLDDPKTIESLEFINKLYNVDKVVYNAGNDIWNYDGNFNGYKAGNILFFPGVSWMMAELKTNLPFDYSLVPFPMGPSSDGSKTFAAGYDGYYMPKGVKDADKVYQVLEELLWFFGDDTAVRDDSTYEWLQTLWLTTDDVDMSIDISTNKGQLELVEHVPGFPIGDVIGPVITGEKTVAQSVEASKQIGIDAIKKLTE